MLRGDKSSLQINWMRFDWKWQIPVEVAEKSVEESEQRTSYLAVQKYFKNKIKSPNIVLYLTFYLEEFPCE